MDRSSHTVPQFHHPPPVERPPLRYGPLTFQSRYLLSPLAGYTNLSFRRVVREVGGVGLATTDLVNARALLEGGGKTLQLIETCPQDAPLAVQIFGHDRQTMVRAAKLLEGRGVDSIDINMGCPVDHVTRTGAGASMMQQAGATVDLVRAVVEAVRVPVTVKMRLGWDETQLTAPKFARLFEEAGVAAVAIHGRTRAQGFSGSVNREGIRRVVEAVDSIPVIGNGDVRSVADAARMLDETGCAGVSVGRGALANPWIFRQLAEWERSGGHYGPAGTFDDRLALLRRQFGYLVEQIGFERGVGLFRRTGHWYLKAMRVRAGLRHAFQQASTPQQVEDALNDIATAGPIGADRTGLLPDMQVPVPSGPVERW
jgi:nifR3 family TIM-barrel protein